MLAGSRWIDHDLIVATRVGTPVLPANFDRELNLVVEHAGVPRLASHGLRHTAATHMVRNASDVGELRAVADVLGHGPDVLMRIYAHTLPQSMRAISDKIGRRTRPAKDG
jgi:site-specific recombinase XerD